MDAIRVKMPEEFREVLEELRTRTEGNVWLYLDNKAMEGLREFADYIQEINNFLEIRCKNVRILIGPHTVGWWRVYSLEGEIFFREGFNPQSVVFMTG